MRKQRMCRVLVESKAPQTPNEFVALTVKHCIQVASRAQKYLTHLRNMDQTTDKSNSISGYRSVN